MAIYWPTSGFKRRTFKLCVLTRWDFNFCVRSSPLRGRRRRMKEKKRKKERKQRENSCFVCCTRCAWQRTATRTKTHQHKCFGLHSVLLGNRSHKNCVARRQNSSSAHLDKRRKQLHVSWNSRFDLLTAPKALSRCFGKQHGLVLCLRYNGT